jgi:hypothetical protein
MISVLYTLNVDGSGIAESTVGEILSSGELLQSHGFHALGTICHDPSRPEQRYFA